MVVLLVKLSKYCFQYVQFSLHFVWISKGTRKRKGKKKGSQNFLRGLSWKYEEKGNIIEIIKALFGKCFLK